MGVPKPNLHVTHIRMLTDSFIARKLLKW